MFNNGDLDGRLSEIDQQLLDISVRLNVGKFLRPIPGGYSSQVGMNRRIRKWKTPRDEVGIRRHRRLRKNARLEVYQVSEDSRYSGVSH